jgi:flagellin-like protein
MKQMRKVDNKAISAVIGVILMVAVAIAMAAVAYAYFTGLIGVPADNTPVISLTQDNHDHNTTLSIGDVSDKSVDWSQVWFTLVDKTNQTQWQNSIPAMKWGLTIGLPRTGTVSSGQLITIKTTYSGPLSAASALAKNHDYQFTLVYNQSSGTMGVVEWTQ